MFKIDSNMTIKMSRGDDVKFPLFLNQGTKINPIRYCFSGDNAPVTAMSEHIKSVDVDLETWCETVTEEGSYQFIYTANVGWKLNNVVVDLEDYGITVTVKFEQSLATGDTFTIEFTMSDGCEVYFNLYDVDSFDNKPVFRKTFNSNNQWRGKHNHELPNGDLKIELLHDDPLYYETTPTVVKTLQDLPEGRYIYQLNGKLLDHLASQDSDTPQYVFETLTNRLPFYIVDDDYDQRNWND